MDKLWSLSISSSTRESYKAGVRCLFTFLAMSCVLFSPGNFPELTEDMLIYFVTYCHSRLGLRCTTIKLYLAEIRFHYLQAGRRNPLEFTDRLQCVIRGIKRSQNNVNKQRLPIDMRVLRQICDLLHAGRYSPVIDKTLECMCLLAFYGFLRCGEFTVRNVNSAQQFLRVRDVQLASNRSMFYLSLQSSKTDPFRYGVQIPFFKTSSLCPVTCMISYLTCTRRESLSSSSPLFVDTFQRPFSRDLFISYLRDILQQLGYKDWNYGGHSFRIGAATTAASVGIEDHLIKTLGRWNSSCYIRYIRVPKANLQIAQEKLGSQRR